MNQPAGLPPPKPPPPPCQTDFPPGFLAHNLLRPHSRRIASVHWQGDPVCSDQPTSFDSVTHIIGSPRVYGITGTDATSVKIAPLGNSCPLIDGGSNICVTGNLQLLIDLVDIPLMAISVALDGPPSSFDDTITKQGLLQLKLSDGTMYYQPCYYCVNIVKTIISPAAVLASSDQPYFWTQVGCKDPTTPGSLQFTSRNGRFSLIFDLEYCEGLYYCTSDVYTLDTDPMRGQCHRTVAPNVPGVHCTPPKFSPTSKARQVELEVWTLQFGSPGEHQLNVLPQHLVGTPLVFEYHSFRYIDFKEQAYTRKQAAQRKTERIHTCGAELYMDFGFMRSSTEDYKCPNKSTDQVVTLYDGYSSHLIIVDGASRRVWIFLTSSKDPPIAILRAFISRFGSTTGLVRTDQGGEFARCEEFRTMMLDEFGYVVEPTGADSPSQNGGAEIYNNTLAVKVRTLFMDPGFLQSFALQLLYTRYTCTIGLSTLPLTKPPTRHGTAENLMSPISSCLVLGFALSGRAPGGAN
jgi:hypothetical protein